MTLYVLNEPGTNSGARALAALAQLAGIETRNLIAPSALEPSNSAIHVATTFPSLEYWLAQPQYASWLTRGLSIPGSSLFLSTTAATPACVRTIDAFLPGIVEGIHQIGAGDTEYRVPAATSDGLDVFAGLSFGPVDGDTTHCFQLRPSATLVSSLVTVDSGPCCIKVQREGTSFVLNGCTTVLDVAAPAARDADLLDRFGSFVPFLAYLHSTFGAQCWHNPRPAACVIIDDPLLKPRYGFLNFSNLEAAIDRSGCSTTIAFIPWNHRRSDQAVARRFTRPDRRLSICVHGCDHTGAEFGSTDVTALRSRARRAMRSMDTHQKLTGIAHNRVMVFPQGVFSKPSLKALEQEGFVAAVNTTIHPVDAGSSEISFRDLMDVAVVRFDGTPVFMRHYPGRPARFALDLFLGRPVLIVEHHSFFRGGYDALEWHASFINRISPKVRWTDLNELCSSATLMRRDAAGVLHVQAFSSLVRLVNDGDGPMRVAVTNRWARTTVEAVHWNGHPVAFQSHATGATCEVQLDAHSAGELLFQRAQTQEPFRENQPSTKERIRVFVRRRLCEFRDNHVATSNALRPLAKAIRPVFSRI